MVSVQVSVSMPIEMVNDLDEEAQSLGMSRAQYIREAVRMANGTPFESERTTLSKESAEDSKGAA